MTSQSNINKEKLDRLLCITQLPCGSCIQLEKNKYSKGYHCVQNRHLDEYMPSYFAEKCSKYFCRDKVYEGLEKVKL